MAASLEPALAADREVALHILAPEEVVEGYRAYVADETTLRDHVVELGALEPGADGIARTSLWLDDAISYTVGVTAFNEYGESPLSNQVGIPAESCEPALCDDGNACTIDSCDGAGCLNAPAADGSPCDDGSSETVDDRCVDGACQGLVLACRSDLECDDGNLCNGLEFCDAGSGCISTEPLECGEPGPCADPACDPELGCLSLPRADGTPCDDGDPATREDTCSAGTCRGRADAASLSVTEVVPDVVGPGVARVEIRGQGFELGARVHFANGQGPTPTIRSLILGDADTLSAEIEVRGQGPKRSRYWDVVVSLPEGSQAVLPRGLRVDP